MKELLVSNQDWFENVEMRPHPRPGLCWLTTMLVVPKVNLAVTFYEKTFGFVPIFLLENKYNEIIYARLRYRGINLVINKEKEFNFDGLAPITTGNTPPVIFYLYVDNVDKSFTEAVEKGCKKLEDPYIEFWQDKKARLCDPFGYIWEIAEKVG